MFRRMPGKESFRACAGQAIQVVDGIGADPACQRRSLFQQISPSFLATATRAIFALLRLRIR